ncbi:hypothetical protein ABZU32_22150 [Sphaerisporangium sp. NPDC005288]|uniref:hypothetical protein n=1 Tax=Sphaerisporangium sp. NPDC005288 TaxID=3155114 RepID=UPI0033BBCC79
MADAPAAGAGVSPRAPGHTRTGGAATGRVVLVGVPGLQWADISQSGTPNLWKLVANGASASMSTRAYPRPDHASTCPVAGWLTVSAGRRAGSAASECAPLPVPQVSPDGSASVPGWPALASFNAATSYRATIGSLGQAVRDAGGTVAAVGPGAALAAADKTGNVQRYADNAGSLGDLSRYNLVVVEADDLARAWITRPPAAANAPTTDLDADARARAAAAADGAIGRLLPLVPPGATILVAGLSDTSTSAHLHVAIAQGPSPQADPYRHGHLTATSTRQDALVAVTDVTTTVLRLLGAPVPAEAVGRPWTSGGSAPDDVSRTVTELADADLASRVLVQVRAPFFAVFVSVQLLFYGLTALAMRRRWPGSGMPATTTLPSTSTGPGTEPDAGPGAGLDTGPGTGSGAGPDTGPDAALDLEPGTGPGARLDTRPDAGLGTEAGAGPDAGPGTGLGTTPGTGPGAGRDGKAGGAPDARGVPVGARAGAGVGARRVLRGWASWVPVATQVMAVLSGAVAVSTFLAQLVPWWSLSRPMTALIVTIMVFTGLLAGLAFAGPWRAHPLGPLTIVAAVTSLALLADVVTGSRLQVNAVTGYEPVTGGRFYGFSNIAFAVYATGTLLALAGVAQVLAERGRRVLGLSVCLGYGLLAIFADGWPGWGADFGGVPAFVLGFAVFMLLLSGRRVTVVRLAAVAVAGAVLIGLIAVADWLRPSDQRTHLGAFVQQVADGEALPVVGRKIGAMLGTLGNWQLTVLSLAALAFLFLVLARPSRWGAPALGLAYAQAPALRAGLFGVLTTALAGFLVNDSGIAIPAMALTVAVPLTLAASIRALQRSVPTTPERPSAPAGSTAPPGTAAP